MTVGEDLQVNSEMATDRVLTVKGIAMVLAVILLVVGCRRHSGAWQTMDTAECVMEERPDSALAILEDIDGRELSGAEEQARLALLMSMALDKNYIDTKNFDVLQPAIDYYLKNGSADEKLRTYYYQGRIFQNRGDRDNALNSFIKGIDISVDSSDSLSIARTLVAQGGLYNEFYDFDSYTNCHLRAADIYKQLSRTWHEFDCLLNALNGAISLSDKALSDSILSICEGFESLDDTQRLALTGHRLSHAIKFDDIQGIDSLTEHLEDSSELDSNLLLDLAFAHHKGGNDQKARQLLDLANDEPDYDTLKYLAISVPILENTGDYKNALAAYREFSHKQDSINTLRLDQKSKYVEDKHNLELKAQKDAREKVQIIWGCLGGLLFLIMVVIILLLLFRSYKGKKDLAIERARNTELENRQLKSDKELAIQQAKISEQDNEKLKSQREKLALENKNLQLEMDKKASEAENLAHRVEILENESASLKELMDSQEELPSEVQRTIKVRIEMLNALIAGHITDNKQFDKSYESWIKELTEDTEEFMNSNRLAFQASHPGFIQYFEEHDLTISEINYVCLYAIGLKGKEVGAYMKKRSHVNISSGIRKKLGIDKHETNIGIYVRKLLKNL